MNYFYTHPAEVENAEAGVPRKAEGEALGLHVLVTGLPSLEEK